MTSEPVSKREAVILLALLSRPEGLHSTRGVYHVHVFRRLEARGLLRRTYGTGAAMHRPCWHLTPLGAQTARELEAEAAQALARLLGAVAA